jgi:hypothetical protein
VSETKEGERRRRSAATPRPELQTRAIVLHSARTTTRGSSTVLPSTGRHSQPNRTAMRRFSVDVQSDSLGGS